MTSHSKLFIIFFLFFFFTTTFALSNNNTIIHKLCPKQQSDALLRFKHSLSSFNSTNDDLTDYCGNNPYPILMSWNTSTDCCNWDGVECDDSTGDVIKLGLNCGRLQGTLHPNISLFNHLPRLTYLELSWNQLNGTLPSWLFTSPSLQYLSIYNNMFSGNVPFHSFALPSLQLLSFGYNELSGQIDMQTFSQLTNLYYLDLRFNNFSGELELDTLLSTLTNLEILSLSHSGFSVTTSNTNHYVNPGFRYLYLASCKLKVFPNSLRAMKQLEQLDLSSNLIEGPFPPSICNISNLQALDMSNNRFGGFIPQCFGNITSYLRMINIGHNSFQGTIPSLYNNCENLEGLVLKGNQLQGEVPSSLSKCQSLKVVDLGNNNLNGTFPSWLGDLPNLQALVLKSNNFHGHIQPSATVKSPFSSLRVLDLSSNRFGGQLPTKYFQNFNSMKNVVKKSQKPEYLSTGYLYYSFVVAVKGVDQDFPQISADYTIINLSNNTFEGHIPNVIGGLNSLIVLNLSHNSLNGRIPDSLGKLSEIESLDLSCNQLSGNIPQRLADLRFLEFLNLSRNHLEGRIPQGNQLRTFEENSYYGNPKLCGGPLPKKCNEYLHEPQVETYEDEEESGLPWKMAMLGYGCGTIIGLVMGYLMLSSTRPNWLSAIADAGEHMILKRRDKRRVYIRK